MVPSLLGFAIVGIVLLILFKKTIRHFARQRNARQQLIDSGQRCPCGYSLIDLEMARCPECGRVLHFNATSEEMGLTPDELTRIQEKRRQRQANDA